MAITRRAFLGATLAGVSACSADSGARLAYETLKGAYWRPRDYPLTREQIFGIPYSAMGFWAGRNPKSVVVMEELLPPYRATWRSEDRVLLVTDNGLITSTAGLPQDLGRFEYAGIPVLTLDAIRALGGRPVRGSVDLRQSRRYGVAFDARFFVGEATGLSILDIEHPVTPVEETLRFSEDGAELNNRYWFHRETGVAIAGSRSFSAKAPALHWERLLKPAG